VGRVETQLKDEACGLAGMHSFKGVGTRSDLPIDAVLWYISLYIREMYQYHTTSLCLEDHFMKTVIAVTSTK